jgi:hypothetical protein
MVYTGSIPVTANVSGLAWHGFCSVFSFQAKAAEETSINNERKKLL